MIQNLFILTVSLFLVIKGATLATRYAVLLAETFRLSKYVVGFIVVAVISILPEAFISINAALQGEPSFGLGTLFGSNVADLTLVFALIIALTGRRIEVKSEILKNNIIFPFLLFIPILLGIDGDFTRLEGLILVIVGGVFYYLAFKNGIDDTLPKEERKHVIKNTALLFLSMAVLLAGAHYTVTSATDLAHALRINPILIGMFIIGLGTTVPEMLFSVRAVKKNQDSLAVGDILGTVLADATVLVGILALVKPFVFPIRLIYVTGAFMVVAAFLLFYFMHSGRTLTKKEGALLFLYWVIFAIVEIMINK